MMNKRVVSSLLLLFTTAELVSAGNFPGSGGGCDGEGPIDLLAGPGGGGGGFLDDDDGFDDDGRRRLFLRRDMTNSISAREKQRALQQVNVINVPEPSAEDIALCCTGNGDFAFLMRDLDIGGLAVATEAQGYREIPGNARWDCRAACRDPANGYDLEPCLAACDCKQNCPLSIDFLTVDCSSRCTSADPLELEICLETCETQCGERCRGTFNNYIVPLDIYSKGLEILDCVIGDYTGDSQASCNSGQAFWQSVGHTCQADAGNFDCNCDVPGTCLNVVYPCDFEKYCATPNPSAAPTIVNQVTGTTNKTGGSRKGKGGGKKSAGKKNWDDDDY